MKNCPPPTKAYLDSLIVGRRPPAFRSDLFTIVLQDGTTTYRWTNCNQSLVVGGNTYLAGDGALAPIIISAPFRQSSRLQVDTLDVTLAPGAFKIGGKTMGQLARERYFSGARIERDHLVGPDAATAIANGAIPKLFEGRVGELEPAGPQFIMRCDSELIALNVVLPRYKIQAQCGNVVYDPDCGLSRAAFTIAGAASGSPTATSVPSNSAAIIAKPTGWFNLGVMVFSSGLLNGARIDVQSYTLAGGVGTFALALPLSRAPAPGDTFNVYPGCDRKRASCAAFPNGLGVTLNLPQYRGYPRVPSPESGS